MADTLGCMIEWRTKAIILIDQKSISDDAVTRFVHNFNGCFKGHLERLYQVV